MCVSFCKNCKEVICPYLPDFEGSCTVFLVLPELYGYCLPLPARIKKKLSFRNWRNLLVSFSQNLKESASLFCRNSKDAVCLYLLEFEKNVCPYLPESEGICLSVSFCQNSKKVAFLFLSEFGGSCLSLTARIWKKLSVSFSQNLKKVVACLFLS